MDEIEQLEGQMNMVSWKGWRKDCEHRYAMEAIKSSPPSVICQCGCATCIEAKVGEFKEAEEKVNKYKDELYGKLGIGKGHKTTLQIERERLKEQYVFLPLSRSVTNVIQGRARLSIRSDWVIQGSWCRSAQAGPPSEF